MTNIRLHISLLTCLPQKQKYHLKLTTEIAWYVTYAHKETKTFKCATNEKASKGNVWKVKKKTKKKRILP